MTTTLWRWDVALRGVIPPLISPLTREERVDVGAMAALVDHVLAGGCTGLFVLGGCGEGAWLTTEQRVVVIQAAVRAAAGRVPVLAGVVLAGTGPAEEAARAAADVGADAIVAGAPYYYAVGPATVCRHLERVVEAVRIPALLYNIPSATHHVITVEAVEHLAGHERVLGIKDSAGDVQYFGSLLRLRARWPAFRVLQGNEPAMAASLLLGADGLVPGCANVAPALFVALRQAARMNDVAACRDLQDQVADLWTLHTHGHWLSALKAACGLLGLGNGLPALGLEPLSPNEQLSVGAVLRRHGCALATAAR